MYSSLCCLLLPILLQAQPEKQSPSAAPVVRQSFPILPYIFFDSASSIIPDRYWLLPDRAATSDSFDKAGIRGGLLDYHYHLLNVIGSRLRKHPQTRIEIVGCNSEQPKIGEVVDVSRARGEMVYRYLTDIWGIDTSRVRLLPARGLPQIRSNTRDPLGIVENRRAEISSKDWEIMGPVIGNYPEISGGSTQEIHTLILFKFDSPAPGPLNERAMEKYLKPGIRASSEIVVVAHRDQRLELEDQNRRRSQMRATAVVEWVKKNVDLPYAAISSTIGDSPLVDNSIPEGRFFNRSVVVYMVTAAR